MNNWQSGLYDCFDDYNICCYGYWCTPCLYGENAVQIDGSDYNEACCTYILAGISPCCMAKLADKRKALRMKYGLPEEPCDDCLVVSFCTAYAVCQEARELKIRNGMPNVRPNVAIVFQPTNNVVHMQPVVSSEPVGFIQPK